MATIPNYSAFVGEHCETNTTGNLLQHAGLSLSEPMLFGLGEGLAFGVMHFKNMPAPFIGGRPRNEEITKNLSQHLGFQIEYRETRSKKRAWENVASFIDVGQPVGVKLDMYFLDYFTSDVHFAGHYVAAYGYDDTDVWVVDTVQQGGAMKTSRESLEEGRLWKGPMSSNALTWTVDCEGADIDWPTVLQRAIVANADSYLNPPVSNFGAKGIRKAANLMPEWIHTVSNAPSALAQMGMLMERGGTGGGLFRLMYRDFLTEANTYLDSDEVEAARATFGEAARLWTQVSQCLQAVASDRDALREGADYLIKLAELEESAVKMLAVLSQ